MLFRSNKDDRGPQKRSKPDIASSDSSGSDALLARPPKRAKHSSSEVAESFVLSARAERLQLAHVESADTDVYSQNDQETYWPDSEAILSTNQHASGHYKADPRAKKQCTCGAWKSLQGSFPYDFGFRIHYETKMFHP